MTKLLLMPIRLLQMGYTLLQFLFRRSVKSACRNFLTMEDGITSKPWARNIPNFLSLSRPLVLGPLLMAVASRPAWAVFVLFVVMAATDLLDGMFARELKCKSTSGAILDPLCDKLFYAWCVIALWSKLPPTVSTYAVWVLEMEAGILALQLLLGLVWICRKSGSVVVDDVQSAICGKSKGFFEVVGLCAVILSAPRMTQDCFTLALIAGIASIPEYPIGKYLRKRAARQK